MPCHNLSSGRLSNHAAALSASTAAAAAAAALKEKRREQSAFGCRSLGITLLFILALLRHSWHLPHGTAMESRANPAVVRPFRPLATSPARFTSADGRGAERKGQMSEEPPAPD